MDDFEEQVRTSCSSLGHSDCDVSRMAALLNATPCIQSARNDSKSLALLFKAIGSSFLRKMLSGHLEIPLDDDDVQIYRITALNIITRFCINPDIARHKNVLKMIPYVFELLHNSKETDEILECAIQYFKCLIQHKEGREALQSHNAVKHFTWMYIHLKSDETLDFIEILLRNTSSEIACFNIIMTTLAEEFSKNQTQIKFIICHRLVHLQRLASSHKVTYSAIRTQKWPKMVLKGLKDVLTSRIDDKQRVPALKLASAMVECYGMEWAVEDTEQEPTTPQQRQFQVLLVHLSSIECRMQMEDQPISSILKNADLIIACFAILEKAVQDLLGDDIEMRDKGQIVQSYSDAAAAVMSGIAAISAFEETIEQHKIFVYAMIEFLCSGFAHNVLTTDAEVYKYVPFIMKVAENSFREYEKWYLGMKEVPDTNTDAPVNLFEFLIPALQHFAAGEDGQKIIIDQLDLILAHVDFSWTVVEPIARETGAGFKLSECARSSLSLLVKMTELITDAILVKPGAIEGIPQFPALFSKITTMLPTLENSAVFNPLLSTASILGLVLIKHDVILFEEQDARVVTVLKGSGRFLTTYKNKIPSTEASVFQVGDNTQFWVNIREMWLLGVHLLGSLRQVMPWIEPHIDPDLLSDISQDQ